MDAVIAATAREAKRIFLEHMQKPYKKRISFMQIGLRWIDFARVEPRLYQLLFMPVSKGGRAVTPLNVFENFEGLTEKVLPIIEAEFSLSEKHALKLYNQMILHAHGIACILVAGKRILPSRTSARYSPRLSKVSSRTIKTPIRRTEP